ncbi:hypothetical protein C2G38_2171662 [Gigaspora rosea]|uniref:HCP-like protein n=1 Tax=Gigaspora rosea TaxID=44941 RepID=A0A397VQL0_9GLOM|nr:hypothetical protein C2G38_2171662 [Gigaspora rosea]
MSSTRNNSFNEHSKKDANLSDNVFSKKNKQKPENIINWCLKNQINPIVQCILANFYYFGIWVEKDEHKAFMYYQKSAKMCNPKGLFHVGHCYQNGIGVVKDEYKAFIYYKKSAEIG